nr:CHC2 zinc finger domain-containing protein [Listeria grayi]
MARRIPEEVIDRVRSKADIVDIISNYVQLKKRDAIILVYVLFMAKRRPRFLFHRKSRSSTALAAGKVGMSFHF